MPFNLQTLRRELSPAKVLSDSPAITAYSIDAGIYKIPPRAVVLIESGEDLEKVLNYARANRVPLTARSGGTNLTGNAIGEGIILEFSRLNRLVELNLNERWARVEPGMIYAELNRKLAKEKLFFPPDPSSGEMCKIGGMIGNNSAGAHALKHGATKENVLELEILLANGNWITAKEYSLAEPGFRNLLNSNPSLAGLLKRVQENSGLILEKKKQVSKNSSGYNLFALAEQVQTGRFPLHQLFIGSEGTLGLVREAKIRLVPLLDEVGTALLYFKTLSEMSDAVLQLMKLSPGALEMMDKNTLDLIGRARFGVPSDAEAALIVEFDDSVSHKMEELRMRMKPYQLCGPIAEAYDSKTQAELWRARKAINPALYQYDPYKKPIHFVDDVVVPVDQIPALIPYLEKLFAGKGIPVAIYGHVGNGNAHINPLINLNDPQEFSKMVSLYREVHETVIWKFKGSICGEHGDGRVRAEFLKELYGTELYTLFKEVKKLFDPENLFNPGVKISEISFTEHIDFERYTKPCATCGKCNAVCPVYDVEGEESNAARGWYHVLTSPDYSYDQSSRVVEACLNCKSCRVVCPAGIDVSQLILKKREERPNPVARSFFSLMEKKRVFEIFVKGAAWTQPLWDNKAGRAILEFFSRFWLKGLSPAARIPAALVLPRLSRRSLRERHSDLIELRSPVAYFHGCAANYFDDQVGDSIIKVLKKNGIEVALPPQQCSGTPIQTYGLIDQVKEKARFNLRSLAPFEKVITGCASCTYMLKDYRNLFPEGRDHQESERLASKVFHISEFLVKELNVKFGASPSGSEKKRVTYHSSCHLRAAGVSVEPRELLGRLPGVAYVEMTDSDRCAGGAGTFCIKNPRQSAEIFKRKERGILESGAEIVATSCPACMVQLNSGLKGKGIEVKHIAELLG